MTIRDYLGITVIFGLTVFTLGYLAIYVYFVSYLRRVHPVTWSDLGAPEQPWSVGGYSIQPQMQQLGAVFTTWRFIFSNAHATMEDMRLKVLVWFLRLFIAGCLASWVLLILVILVSSLKATIRN